MQDPLSHHANGSRDDQPKPEDTKPQVENHADLLRDLDFDQDLEESFGDQADGYNSADEDFLREIEQAEADLVQGGAQRVSNPVKQEIGETRPQVTTKSTVKSSSKGKKQVINLSSDQT